MTMLIVAMLSVGFISCGSDDDDDGLADTNSKSIFDPEGTIVVNLQNDNKDYIKVMEITFPYTYIDEYGMSDERTANYSVNLYMNGSNNFTMYCEDVYFEYANATNRTLKIATVGKVSGLGAITSIPSGGWSESAAVVPGNGYVIKYEADVLDVEKVLQSIPFNWKFTRTYNNHCIQYARVYVVEYMTNSYGGVTVNGVEVDYGGEIMGATLKYQSPWNP